MITKIFLLALVLIKSITSALDDPVAFTAIKAGRNDAYISFQTMVVNNKADFNSMYGVFKCTSPGLYFFTFTAMCPENKDLRISLRTNRVPVVTIYSGASNSYNSASASTVLTLSENDIVYLFIEKGDLYESHHINRAFTTFSGFQLSESKSSTGLFSLIGRHGVNSIKLTNGTLQQNETTDDIDINDKIFSLLKLP